MWVYLSQPVFRNNKLSQLSIQIDRLKGHVEKLSKEFYPRNYEERINLEKCADYIKDHFQAAGARVEIQEFKVSNIIYKNIIGHFSNNKSSKIIIGAHYDSYEKTPGADDNASGVAGLIELAYLLKSKSLEKNIDLVAYCLEEPPFFRTDQMGSAIHASSISTELDRIQGVIILECIGYFNDKRGSQKYPMLLLKLFYPDYGNYITVVGSWAQRKFVKQVKKGMKGRTDLPVYSISAPGSIPGIDFSDHLNYWPYKMNAVMITDTAFYRNDAYHQLNDTADTLDYKRMSKVVIDVFEMIVAI